MVVAAVAATVAIVIAAAAVHVATRAFFN